MANAVVGALRVNLGLDSAQFQDGLKNAQSSLAKFGKVAAAGMAAAAAAFATAAAGAGLAMKGVLDEADKMGKAAQSLGVPVDELSRLKHAADMSGVAFDGLSTGMRKLGQAMAEAIAKPGKEVANTFQALGIKLRESDGTMRNSSQVMSDLAEKFAKMPDGAEKTALAMQLFGKSGADLIPMLNAGRDGLQAMKDEADQLGIVIDQRTAKAAESFNDNMSRLSKMVSGVWTRLTSELAPALAAIVDKLVEAARSSGGFGETIRTVARWVVDAVLGIMDTFHRLQFVFPALETAAAAFSATFLRIVQGARVQIASLVDGMLEYINAGIRRLNEATGSTFQEVGKIGASAWVTEIKEQTAEAEAALARSRLKIGLLMSQPLPSEGIRKAMQEMGELGKSSESASDAFRKGMENIEKGAARAKQALSEAARRMKEMHEEGLRLYEATRTPAEALANEIKRLNQLLQAGAIDWDVYNRAIAQAQDKFDNAGKKSNEIAMTMQSSFSTVFDDIVNGTFKAADALKKLAADIMKMMANKAISSLLGSLFGAGGGGGFNFASLFGGIGKNAQGTNNWRGGLSWVGERGPELVNLPRGSQVIPNHEIGQGGGGTSLKVEVVEPPGHRANVQQTDGPQGPGVRVTFDQMVADALLSGGATAGALKALQRNRMGGR